jgi:uncharacterized repeat protein (TIGR03803 family)
MDVAGRLYGTTFTGGKYGLGSVFRLIPPAGGGKWSFQTLYNFCGFTNICPDGSEPEGGLTYAGAASGDLYDGASPLYGSTDHGGWDNNVGPGTVFKLEPKVNGKWRETVLYVSSGGTLPSQGGIVANSESHLFGTTRVNGAGGQGTIFELIPDAKKKNWSEQTLYNFCSMSQCSDGAVGSGGLLIDGSGNLFGTTTNGGVSCADEAGCGVAFKLSPVGKPSAYTVLHSFCTLSDCLDGRYPSAGLIMDQAGTLYGMTLAGGGNDNDSLGEGGGTIYALNGTETVLHAFCAKPDCRDGEHPYGSLSMDSSGNIFGTTAEGGAHGLGVVFELSP